MSLRCLSTALVVLGLSACSAAVPPLQLTAEHPASPLAAEAPLSAPPLAFAEEAVTAAEGDSGHEGMDHGTEAEPQPNSAPIDHSHHAMAKAPEATPPAPMDHSQHPMDADSQPGDPPADHADPPTEDPPSADGGNLSTIQRPVGPHGPSLQITGAGAGQLEGSEMASASEEAHHA